MFLIDWILSYSYLLLGLALFVVALTFIYRDPPKPPKHNSDDQKSDKIKTPNARFEMIPTNGIRLHTLCAGDSSKPLVILLHGFPEFWKGWELQVDALVNAGYYVMVPDQRGYNLSSKPLNIGDYRLDKLADDIVGLIDFAKKEKAYLAGHDWGAFVAWFLTLQRSERFFKTIIVNVPHNSVFIKYVMTDKEQRKMSSYTRKFQIPFLPQWTLSKNNFQLMEASLLKSSNPGTFSSEDIRAYKSAWNDRGTVSCMVNWYRAAFMKPAKQDKSKKTAKIPVKIIWGVKDAFLKKEMAQDSLKYCENGQLEYIEDATHWVLHEKPEKVSKIIVDFFKS